jgi:guanylate kinase
LRGGFEKIVAKEIITPLENSSQKIIIITAPSGSGKTTIVQHLLQQMPQLAFSVSACTRKPRANEVDGVNYHFIDIEEFTHKIATHEFAEFEMVYEGKYYGTLKSELNRIWENKQTPVVDIDVQGALRLMKHYQLNALSIFIQAPSLEILAERLKNRGTETEFSLNERIAKASDELNYASRFNHTVVNDQLDVACNQVEQLIAHFLHI